MISQHALFPNTHKTSRRLVIVVLSVILWCMTMLPVSSAYDCAIFDTPKGPEYATLDEYIQKFGLVGTAKLELASPGDSDWTGWPICTKLQLQEWTSDHNISLVVTKPDVLHDIKSKINDSAVLSQIEFAESYNPSNGICGNPPTTTIAILCKTYFATEYLRSGFSSWMYPYADKYPANYTPPMQNYTLFEYMANHTIPQEIRNTTLSQSLDAFLDSAPHLLGLFSWSGGALSDLNNYLEDGALVHSKNFAYNLIHLGNHDLFLEAKDRLYRHVMKPIDLIRNFKKRADVQNLFNNWVRTTSNNIEEFSENVESIIHHYKNAKFAFVDGKNMSTTRILHEYMLQYQQMDWKASDAFLLKRFRKRASFVTYGKNWANLADPNNTFLMDSPTDLINGAGSFVSWLFHLDNQYNESGCLYKGFPWVPKETLVCRTPRFVGPQNATLWPVGFDPYKPHCEDYFYPWVWYKMGLYGLTSALPDWFWFSWGWLQIHTGIREYMFWIVYDINTPNVPANTYPCLISTSFWAISFTFWAIFAVFFLIGTACQIETDVNKEIYNDGSDDDEKRTPDITKLIPPPNVVSEQLLRPLDILASGDPSQAINYGQETINSFQDQLRQSTSSESRGLRSSGMSRRNISQSTRNRTPMKTARPKIRMPVKLK